MCAALFCECEHESHFDGTAHPYGQGIVTTGPIISRRTLFGTFTVCEGCGKYHYTEAMEQEAMRDP